jgi:hypothetical protein
VEPRDLLEVQDLQGAVDILAVWEILVIQVLVDSMDLQDIQVVWELLDIVEVLDYWGAKVTLEAAEK